MKVLHITAAYKPAYIYGGPTMSVAMLCEQLAKAGVILQVYTTTANGKNELDIADAAMLVDGVLVTYFERITKDHTHFSPALLWAVWKNADKFDAIHVHTWWNLVSVLACLIALMRGRPVLLSPRGTLSAYSFQNKNNNIKSFIHNLLGKYLLKRCHFHVTSYREAESTNRLLKPESITNIPNFVKLPPNNPVKEPQPANPLKLIFLSRIEEKKGLDILITALPLLAFPYLLTIAGNGDKNYIDTLKSIAKKNGADKHINWVGFQTEEKFNLLQTHHLLVLPSHDENFGNVIIESLSQGTAVLISKQVGLADYVVSNHLGWECELNARAFGSALDHINANRGELNRISIEAPPRIFTDFNNEHLTKQYTDLYNQIIDNGRL